MRLNPFWDAVNNPFIEYQAAMQEQRQGEFLY